MNEKIEYLKSKRKRILNLQSQFAKEGYTNIDHALDFVVLAICEEIDRIYENRGNF